MIFNKIIKIWKCYFLYGTLNETLQKKKTEIINLKSFVWLFHTWKSQFSRIGFNYGKAPVRPRHARRIVIRREKVKMQSVQRSSFLASVKSTESIRYSARVTRTRSRLYFVAMRAYQWYNGDYIPARGASYTSWRSRKAAPLCIPAREYVRKSSLSMPHAAPSKSFICSMSR